MSNDTTTKFCHKCQTEKPIEQFSRNKSTKDGLAAQCKSCDKAYRINKKPVIIVTVVEKECTKCKILKEIAEFSRDKNTKDGLCCWCKGCINQYKYQNKDKFCLSAKIYREKHKERYSNYDKERYWSNRDFHIRRRQESRLKNIDRERAKNREYWKSNPEKRKAKESKRRAMKLNAEGSHTTQELHEQWNKQNGLCFWCDKVLENPFQIGGCNRQTHLDHVIPLIRGGSNSIDNLVWSCQPCNNSKASRLPSEWEGSNGR